MSENLLRAMELSTDWLTNLSGSVKSLLTRVDHIEKEQGHLQQKTEMLEKVSREMWGDVEWLKERLKALEEKGSANDTRDC
jgi:chromosome segregation ATPase